MKRKTIWVDETDEQAAALICQKYGCETEAAAFRLAVRILAQAKQLDLQLPTTVDLPPRPKHARRSAKA